MSTWPTILVWCMKHTHIHTYIQTKHLNQIHLHQNTKETSCSHLQLSVSALVPLHCKLCKVGVGVCVCVCVCMSESVCVLICGRLW